MNDWTFILKDRILKNGLKKYKAFPKQKDYGLESPEGTALLEAIITTRLNEGYGGTSWSDAKKFLIECLGIEDDNYQYQASFYVRVHLNKFHFYPRMMVNE